MISGVAALLVLAFGPTKASSSSCLETYNDGDSIFPTEVRMSIASRGEFSADPAIVEAASLVSISYGSHFKVLTEALSREQYVLVQCGAPEVSDAEVDAVAPLPEGHERKRFTIPLQEIATESTVQLSFLEALGVADRVRFVSSYAVGACWQKALGCDAGYAGQWGDATLRATQDAAVTAVLSDCTPPCHEGEDPNVIHFSASQDVGPLHTAEHIKFLAAFFNKEAEANSIFAGTVEAYNDLMTAPASSSPKVAWVSKDSYGSRFVLSLATYKTNFVTDAGGRNIGEDEVRSSAGSNLQVTDAVAGSPGSGQTLSLGFSDFADVPAAAAALVAALADVDVIIDETYASVPSDYNMESFLSEFGITSDSTLPAIVGQKVFRLDGTLSESDGMDWFESRLAHPQWVLQDLARAFRGEGETFRYLRNIATGETPHVVEVAHCTTQLPACGDVTSPADIPVLFAITDATVIADVTSPADIPDVTSPADTPDVTSPADVTSAGADSAAVRPALFGLVYVLGLQLW